MPRLIAAKIRAAKFSKRAFKLYDQDGLSLLVQPNGSRDWRLRWKQAGRERLLALGLYPDVSLAICVIVVLGFRPQGCAVPPAANIGMPRAMRELLQDVFWS